MSIVAESGQLSSRQFFFELMIEWEGRGVLWRKAGIEQRRFPGEIGGDHMYGCTARVDDTTCPTETPDWAKTMHEES
jgi:hypothetical protein